MPFVSTPTPALDLATKIVKLIVLVLLGCALGLLLPEERDSRAIVRDTHLSIERFNRLLLEADLTSMYVRKASMSEIQFMNSFSGQLSVLAANGIKTEQQATATLAQVQVATAELQKATVTAVDSATQATVRMAPAQEELAQVLEESRHTLVQVNNSAAGVNSIVQNGDIQKTLSNTAVVTQNAAEATDSLNKTMKDIQSQVHALPTQKPLWWRILHWF